MAWSETMFIIQHFYNVFNIDERLTDIEYKSPLVAKSVNGQPQLPDGTTINDLTPGTLWFIKDNNNPSTISAVTILKEDKTFENPIPFSIDLKEIPLENDLQQIASDMGLVGQNYYDIIKSILQILKTVPVKYGGTGLTNISEGAVLMGDEDGNFKEITFDSTPIRFSENLLNSGVLYNQFDSKAKKNHASGNKDYGVASANDYGHVRITSNYNLPGSDPNFTAISATGIQELSNKIKEFSILGANNGNQTLIIQ